MLPDNYYSSLVQLKLLEKRLAKDPHLRDQYSKTIEDDLSKGYVIQFKFLPIIFRTAAYASGIFLTIPW